MDKQTGLDSSNEWLLQGPEWMRYAVRTHFLGEVCSSQVAIRSKDIQSLIEVQHNPEKGCAALINGQVFYKLELYWYLFFLSDAALKWETWVSSSDLEDQFISMFGNFS